MAGPWLLAAPVFDASTIRRDVFLPGAATTTMWFDYWGGSPYPGNSTIDFPAPLDTLPLFVRSGAIVPTWPPMNHFDAAPHDPIILELWPDGNTSFQLYEDDGVTREALPPTNAYFTTPISVSAPQGYLGHGKAGNVTVAIGPATGKGFKGQLHERGWRLNVRTKRPPVEVFLLDESSTTAATTLPKMHSTSELEAKPSGWFHDRTLQKGAGGLLMVKLPTIASTAAVKVVLSSGTWYPHVRMEECASSGSRPSQRFAFNASSGRLHTASGACLTIGVDDDPASHTKAVEAQPCDATKESVQRWAQKASGQLYSASSGGKQCIDQDVQARSVEMYGCHQPEAAGNQRWKLPTGTDPLGPIVSVQNGLCMSVAS